MKQNKKEEQMKQSPSKLKKLAAHLVLLGAIGLTASLVISRNKTRQDLFESSVKITNMAENSGGTGIVLSSSDIESQVLTNAHVCGLFSGGAKVIKNGLSYSVRSYQVSQTHDLCLLKVSGNLGSSVKIAKSAPVPYLEEAHIVGHPSLMPTVVTGGHFSGNMVVTVMTGFRECTEEDLKSDLALICLLAGGMPVLKSYVATLVTATIMPGSSGSAVYNSQNELSGVAFAGSGELSYAITVPYANMRYFLDEEVKDLESKTVNNEVSLLPKKESRKSVTEKLKSVCETVMKDESIKNGAIGSFCKNVVDDLIWRK